jgi:adenosylhomocysteine nucleosidase
VRRWWDFPCSVYHCQRNSNTVIVVESGVGPGQGDHLRQLFDAPVLDGLTYHPRFVISTGYSGALLPQLCVGDVVIGTEVLDLQRQCWPTTWPEASRIPSLLRARLLTVPALVSGPLERQRLALEYQVGAVDMEAATVACICQERGLPFGCVRVISDTVQTELSPALVKLLNGSRVSWQRILKQVISSPRLMLELWRLAHDSHKASTSLANVLVELLE